MSDEILIRVKTVDEYDSYDCDLVHEQVTFEQLLGEQCSYSLKDIGYIKINVDKSANLSKEAIKYLREYGWSHVNSAKNREEKKVLTQKYYLVDELGHSYNYSSLPRFKEIDLNDVSDDQIKQLAKGGDIVQSVTLKSILSAKDYKKLETQKKANKAKVDEAKATKKKKSKITKEKALDKARKLLQEAGEV